MPKPGVQLPLIAFVDGQPTSWFTYDAAQRVWRSVLSRRDAVNDRLSAELLRGPWSAAAAGGDDVDTLLDLARLVDVLDEAPPGAAGAAAPSHDRLVRWAIRRVIRGWRRAHRRPWSGGGDPVAKRLSGLYSTHSVVTPAAADP